MGKFLSDEQMFWNYVDDHKDKYGNRLECMNSRMSILHMYDWWKTNKKVNYGVKIENVFKSLGIPKKAARIIAKADKDSNYRKQYIDEVRPQDICSLTREKIVEKINEMISGHITRGEASSWASMWLHRFYRIDIEKNLLDALERMTAADMISTDRHFLYDISDFERWIDDVMQ